MKYRTNGMFGEREIDTGDLFTYTVTQPVKGVPYRCPVCDGRGMVPFNFYNRHMTTSNITADVCCRSCSGRGVIYA